MTTYYTSDLHFRHRNIVKYTNRGVEVTQDNHDTWLTNIWNTTVSPEDTVWHMGDFAFAYKYDIVADIVKSLNGKKFFIKGNHDKASILKQLVTDGLIDGYYDYQEIQILGNDVCLFHYPIASHRNADHGSWHLFGHCHGNFQSDLGKVLDVGLDNGYNLFGTHRFFTEQDIKTYMDSRTGIMIERHDRNNRHE